MTGSATNAYGDRTQVERDARLTRMHAIMALPQAQGRENAAFALAVRGDIPVGRAATLLAGAPNTNSAAAAFAWIDTIPARPPLEIVR